MRDNILHVNYELEIWNAIELSEMLKDILKNKYNINDLNEFSNETSQDNISESHPEIYEYQNFFLLKRVDGTYLLLDGFRRLLLYSGLPDIDVNVRVYDENELTTPQLIKLMLMLNHTKFFGGIGKYYDKGFNLLFSILYGFDVNKFFNVFEGYTAYSQVTVDGRYSVNSINRNVNVLTEIREKLVLPKSVEDLKFLYELFKLKPHINNFTYLGSLFFEYRMKYPDVKFSLEEFITLSDTDDIKKLEENCPKPQVGVREADHVKKLMEFYANIVAKMCGEETKETYVEALARVKAIKVKLKKNKNIIHLNAKTNWEKKKDIGNFIIKNKKSPKVTILVFPNLENNNVIHPDVYDGIINKMTISNHLMATNLRYYCNMKDIEGFENIENSVFGGTLKKISTNSDYFNRDNSRNDVEIYIDLSETLDNKVEIIDYRKEDK